MGEINMYKKRMRTMKSFMHLKQKCAVINYFKYVVCCEKKIVQKYATL